MYNSRTSMASWSQASLSLVRTNYVRITHENTDIWKVGSPEKKTKMVRARAESCHSQLWRAFFISFKKDTTFASSAVGHLNGHPHVDGCYWSFLASCSFKQNNWVQYIVMPVVGKQCKAYFSPACRWLRKSNRRIVQDFSSVVSSSLSA